MGVENHREAGWVQADRRGSQAHAKTNGFRAHSNDRGGGASQPQGNLNPSRYGIPSPCSRHGTRHLPQLPAEQRGSREQHGIELRSN
jgi:hypothetical protein